MTASRKTYLKTIYYLSAEGAARPADIAAALGVSRPSVSKALSGLTEAGLAAHQPYGDVSLTPEGQCAVLAIMEADARLQRMIQALQPAEL